MFDSGLTGRQLIGHLSAPEVSRRLGLRFGLDVHAVSLSARGGTFQVNAGVQSYIVRLPRDPAHLDALRQEARVAAALRGCISLRLPDTRVVEDLPEHPVFAIHRRIEGDPLATEHYTRSLPAARERLVADLACFFRQMHGVPLDWAAVWLGLERTTGDLITWTAPAASFDNATNASEVAAACDSRLQGG